MRKILKTSLSILLFLPVAASAEKPQPQPLLFQPTARTPRNAALKSFLVGGSWECTGAFGTLVLTFRNNSTATIVNTNENETFEIRETQIVLRSAPDKVSRVFVALDAQQGPPATARIQSGLFESVCKRVPERTPQAKTSPTTDQKELLLPALDKLGYEGIYLGMQESEALTYTKNLGCEPQPGGTTGKKNYYFAPCREKELSIHLDFHPLNHRLYGLTVSFRDLGAGGTELLLERLSQKYGKPTRESFGDFTWEFKDGKRIDFDDSLDWVVYRDIQIQKDAERAEAKGRLGDL